MSKEEKLPRLIRLVDFIQDRQKFSTVNRTYFVFNGNICYHLKGDGDGVVSNIYANSFKLRGSKIFNEEQVDNFTGIDPKDIPEEYFIKDDGDLEIYLTKEDLHITGSKSQLVVDLNDGVAILEAQKTLREREEFLTYVFVIDIRDDYIKAYRNKENVSKHYSMMKGHFSDEQIKTILKYYKLTKES